MRAQGWRAAGEVGPTAGREQGGWLEVATVHQTGQSGEHARHRPWCAEALGTVIQRCSVIGGIKSGTANRGLLC